MFSPFLLLVLVTPTFLSIADGCFRRAITQPPPSTTPIPDLENHKVECEPLEVTGQGCLNGGTCFVVKIGDNRVTNCACTEDYTGERCQERHIPPDLLPRLHRDKMKTANIAAGVVVAVLVVFVVLLAIYVYIRWRRKRELTRDREFNASPEELGYRQPFNRRSSIIESEHRASFRRQGTPNPSPNTNTNDVNININKDCHSPQACSEAPTGSDTTVGGGHNLTVATIEPGGGARNTHAIPSHTQPTNNIEKSEHLETNL
ncbi:unnamed protein product [Owenia fusiformis]|uniref:EGF-like domain-containing protein n=1 Tax=Owenia fusiformis TaxID=6347 RepID=A0A8S4PMM8_OWEFU|nr:unnamed protein product [Owenia fusiformis]